jgi:putative transposase
MPRLPRIIVPGTPHHATQRGNNRQMVFRSDDDRRVYLHCLRTHAETYGLQVVAYCLMGNHTHVIGVPEHSESLGKALGRTHFQYTHYFNGTHGRSGHLWQNRYFSCPMDDGHAYQALRYVEQNPVRAGIAKQAWEYPWSSAQLHCGLAKGSTMLDMVAWWERWTPEEWREVLRVTQDDVWLRRIRSGTTRGRPLGGDDFLTMIEERFGLDLRRKRGRPARNDNR